MAYLTHLSDLYLVQQYLSPFEIMKSMGNDHKTWRIYGYFPNSLFYELLNCFLKKNEQKLQFKTVDHMNSRESHPATHLLFFGFLMNTRSSASYCFGGGCKELWRSKRSHTPDPCYSKCGPRTSSNSITWELVRKAESQTLPPTCLNQNLHLQLQLICMQVTIWGGLWTIFIRTL